MFTLAVWIMVIAVFAVLILPLVIIAYLIIFHPKELTKGNNFPGGGCSF